MKCKIREAGLEDSEVVFKLTKQAFQDYLDPAFSSLVPALQESRENVVADIKQKDVLIAYYDKQPAGSVRLSAIDNKSYKLSRLGVLNQYQGQQVGQKLIEEVEQRVKEVGGEQIILYSAYQKKELLNFYQGLGYKIEEIREDDDYTRAKLIKKLIIDN
ncbi:hypothetical protein JCM16358_05830 [Halanaerocella petrolearia]